MATQLHPMVRIHPKSGRPALFVNMGYTIGIDGMSAGDATALLTELFAHQTRPEFVDRHRWGIEALLVLRDICGLSEGDSIKVIQWAAQALLQQTFTEFDSSARAKSKPARRKKSL